MKTIFILELFVYVTNTKEKFPSYISLQTVASWPNLKALLGSYYSAHYLEEFRDFKTRKNPSKSNKSNEN